MKSKTIRISSGPVLTALSSFSASKSHGWRGVQSKAISGISGQKSLAILAGVIA